MCDIVEYVIALQTPAGPQALSVLVISSQQFRIKLPNNEIFAR